MGRIEVHGSVAVIEVSPDWSRRLARALDGLTFQGRHLRAWPTGETGLDGGMEAPFQRLRRWLTLEAEARQILEARLPPGEAESNGTSLGPRFPIRSICKQVQV